MSLVLFCGLELCSDVHLFTGSDPCPLVLPIPVLKLSESVGAGRHSFTQRTLKRPLG